MSAEKIAAIVYLLAIVVAIVAAAFTVYHTWRMLLHIKPGRETIANLLGAFAGLPSSLYDEKGLAHRAAMVRALLVCGLAAIIAIAAELFLGGGRGA
jgi:hypothetical protein